MQEIELTIINPFASGIFRPERVSTVFVRAYAQLTTRKKNPGQIIPVFTRIENDYQMFGIVTLNTGGSVSFFPDFYNLDNFDHLTINADFTRKKGHFTKVEKTGTHEKFHNFEAAPLVGNDYRHLITFGMNDGNLLMDSPPEIKLPKITYDSEEERLVYISSIENSVLGGPCLLEFPDEAGAYFIQILIVPKGGSRDETAIERTFIEKLLVQNASLEGQIHNCNKIDIPTPEKCGFTICIITLKVPGQVRGSFAFLMAQDSTKTPITV